MNAVSSDLNDLLRKLQSIECLDSFALAGGTNLALRYNHRESIDIDLFSNGIEGLEMLSKIQASLQETFKENLLFILIEDPGHGEQFIFIKSLIKSGAAQIKVEFLQNMQILNSIEIIDGIRMLSTIDIGLMKLKSAPNRKAKKDVYDLDIITDQIPLPDLMAKLALKEKKFEDARFKSLFDLDNEITPVEDPSVLLNFENSSSSNEKIKLNHSSDHLKIIDGKSWQSAKLSWRRKVKSYCDEIKINL